MTIWIPDTFKPERLTDKPGGPARWLKEGNQIVGLSIGNPARLSAKGNETLPAVTTST